MKHKLLPVAALLGSALLICPLSASAKGRSAIPSLAVLLAKHDRATATPQALLDQSGTRFEYAIDAAGMGGSMVEYTAPPKKSRVEFALGPITETMADDGSVSWQKDSTGNVRIVRGAELSELRAEMSFSLEEFDPLKDHKKAKVVLRRKRDPATHDFVLDVTPTGGEIQNIYINPHTYLIDRIIERHGGLVGSVDIQKYQSVGGYQIPAKIQIGYAGMPILVGATLIKAQRGLTLDAALFAPPSSPKDYAFLKPDAHGAATIPFSSPHNEILLSVLINGQPRHLILDSGAASSFLTEQAAKSLKLSTNGSIPAVGYGGSAKTGVATQATIELPGAIKINGQLLYVIKDPSLSQALADKGGIDGALGYDLLARFVVTIDYKAQTITLTEPAQFVKPHGAGVVTLPVTLETHTPSITASVDGKQSGKFLIDTGDSGGVHLYNKYAEANGLVNHAYDPHASVQTGAGIGGSIMEVSTPGHSLKLGAVTLPNISVATIAGPGISSFMESAGGIGNIVLKDYRVTFDYSRQVVYLEPQSAVTAPKAPSITVLNGDVPHYERRFHISLGLPTRLTLDQLLARHLKAMGGKGALTAIKSTRVVAEVDTGGTHGAITTLFSVPDKEYENDRLGILNITEGYDGKTAWRQDSNGNVRVLASEEIKDLRNEVYYDTNSYVIPGRIPGKISLRPRREPGTGHYIMDSLPEGGKPITFYIDPKTYLIVKMSQDDDDVLTTTFYSDYRRIDGVPFPMKQRVTNGQTRYDIKVTVKTLENNVPAPDSLFRQPTSAKTAQFLTPGSHEATIPFDNDDGEISFNALLNGQPERLFLDTGSGGLALADTVVKSLHLKVGGFLEARGYGGSTDFRPVEIDTLEIPCAIRLLKIAAVAISLPASFDGSSQKPLAGFVGYDLLSHYVVRIDYVKKRLTFIDPDHFTPTIEDGQMLPLSLDDDVPYIKASIDDLPQDRFLIDTGDVAAIRLYEPYISNHHLRKRYPTGVPVAGGGVAGISEAIRSRIGAFKIAGVELHSVPADFSLDPKGGASQVNAGSIGAWMLSRFIITFDYPHSRVYLSPNPGADQSFAKKAGITPGARVEMQP